MSYIWQLTIARADSIKKAYEDSIRIVRETEAKERYSKCHDWNWVPVIDTSVKCPLCDKYIDIKDSAYCMAFSNDTLFCVTPENAPLGMDFYQIHALPVLAKLKQHEPFNYHLEVFEDSIAQHSLFTSKSASLFYYLSLNDVLDDIKKTAPYG